MKDTVLVTGGAGYIGSHTCIELLNQDYEIIILDNLSNSKSEALRRIEAISGKSFKFYQTDLRDQKAMEKIFQNHRINAVIHFAGLKAVGESCEQPLAYYQNNFIGTVNLVQLMEQYAVKKIVFSSSATVYGDPDQVPIAEHFPLSATNPYGRTKLMIEDLFRDLSTADAINHCENPWKTVLLRYFNPIGAHYSGMIGEDPQGTPNNLMPYITQVGIGKLEQLSVFGNDYPTRDGTGVRDYIHVVDLAKGHIKALEALENARYAKGGCQAINLGTGKGSSVLELIQAFEQVTGISINFRIVKRRAGDIAECYADPSLAERALGWSAEKDLQAMVADTWRWQQQNPQGYN